MESKKTGTTANLKAATKAASKIAADTKTTEQQADTKATESNIDAEQLIVMVPKKFSLRHSNSVIKTFAPGVQKMSRVDAEHWYSKANGVEIHELKD